VPARRLDARGAGREDLEQLAVRRPLPGRNLGGDAVARRRERHEHRARADAAHPLASGGEVVDVDLDAHGDGGA
jgi:hypothetical protein